MANRRNRRVRGVRQAPPQTSDGRIAETLARVSPRHIFSSFREPMSVSTPSGMVGPPDRLRITLKYSQIVTHTGSPGPAGQVFAVNSCFDPDVSGTGHQPSFYDWLTAAYNRYCVLGCSAIIEVDNESTIALNLAAIYSDSDVSAQSVQFLAEANRAKSVLVGPAGSVNTKRVIMPAIAISTIMGQLSIEPDSNMYATVGVNPTDVAFLIYKVQSSDLTTNVTARIKTTILMDVVMKDLNPSYAS